MVHVSHRFRLAGVAACGITALTLSACGTGGSSDQPSAAPSEAGTSTEAVTIDYLHRLPDGEGMTPVSDIVERWNAENADIQVKATKFDGESTEMVLRLETDVKAGNAPCLAQVGYGEVPDLFVKGLFEDVSSEASSYAGNFSAGAMAGMTVGDAIVGLPQDVGPLVYYYNATEFERLGISAPKTADDLKSVAETAKADGKYAVAFTADEAWNWMTGQAAAAGAVWFTSESDTWKVDTSDSGTAAVAALWQGLLDDERALVAERWGEGFDKAIVDGQLIGHIGAAWEAGFLLDSLDGTDAEGAWRIAQIPDLGAGQMTGPDGGSGVAVLSGCEHPAEAMKFNDWFNTQVDDLASQGLVVAATDAPKLSEKAERQFGGQDISAELSTATANLNPDFVYAPGYTSLKSMNAVAANAGSGSAKVSDIYENAQKTAIDSLKSLGLPVAE